jgi:hypothetical protein
MDNPIFIDFEASSMQGFPIQVAYGSCEADLKCHLIKPLNHWNNAIYLWDFNAQDIHGFSKAYINDYGVNATTVAKEVSEDLKGKTIYADSGVDLFWLQYLLDDSAEVTGETYAEPRFKLINKLMYERGMDDIKAAKAMGLASERFRAKGLIAHKADNDVLRHIYTWEALMELSQ